jgi:glutaminase
MGDLEGLNRLSNICVSLDKGDYDNRTPLHLAASSGNFEIVQYLVEKGVNVNTKDRWGATPLNDASRKDIIEYLKSKGAVYGVE